MVTVAHHRPDVLDVDAHRREITLPAGPAPAVPALQVDAALLATIPQDPGLRDQPRPSANEAAPDAADRSGVKAAPTRLIPDPEPGPDALDVAALEPLLSPAPVDIESFVDQLDTMRSARDDGLAEHRRLEGISVDSAIGATLVLSTGFVQWVLRAGTLAASFLSVVPLWRHFDPLPIRIAGKLDQAAPISTDEDPEQASSTPDSRLEAMFENADTDS